MRETIHERDPRQGAAQEARKALTLGIPPALTAAVGLTHGSGTGLFGDRARSEASAATGPAWTTEVADGFSWKDDRFAEYRNSGPGAGAETGDRPHPTGSQAAGQETADWLGSWTPTAS